MYWLLGILFFLNVYLAQARCRRDDLELSKERMHCPLLGLEVRGVGGSVERVGGEDGVGGGEGVRIWIGIF